MGKGMGRALLFFTAGGVNVTTVKGLQVVISADSGSAAIAKSDGGEAKATNIFDILEVKPYGVLGAQSRGPLDSDRKQVEESPEKTQQYVVVDSTAEEVTQGKMTLRDSSGGVPGFAFAHTESYNLYNWIRGFAGSWQTTLPQEVTDSVQHATQAKFHAYAGKTGMFAANYKVIHTIAPDFSSKKYSGPKLDPAVPLAATYANVFKELLKAKTNRVNLAAKNAAILRVPVLSDGRQAGMIPTQAGPYQEFDKNIGSSKKKVNQQLEDPDLFPALTAKAIEVAFKQLKADERAVMLSHFSIELCVYNKDDFQMYQTAIANRKDGVPQETPVSPTEFRWEPEKKDRGPKKAVKEPVTKAQLKEAAQRWQFKNTKAAPATDAEQKDEKPAPADIQGAGTASPATARTLAAAAPAAGAGAGAKGEMKADGAAPAAAAVEQDEGKGKTKKAKADEEGSDSC